MALTARGRVDEQKQAPKAKYREEPSSYKVTRDSIVTESRPVG